jgi:hypothetical protein
MKEAPNQPNDNDLLALYNKREDLLIERKNTMRNSTIFYMILGGIGFPIGGLAQNLGYLTLPVLPVLGVCLIAVGVGAGAFLGYLAGRCMTQELSLEIKDYTRHIDHIRTGANFNGNTPENMITYSNLDK